MAEFIMKHLVAQAGRADEFEIASAAVSTEEIGNDIYPPAKRMLSSKGVPFEHRAARQMTRADYAYYDHIVCMDQSNLRWLRYIIGEDLDHKVSLLKQWSNDQINDNMVNISDPWYTGDFTKAYDDILEGCQGMLKQI
jgi:protein-tyrosine phosphatase